MSWGWVVSGWVAWLAAAPVTDRIDMNTLVALFPKPPAAVIERIDSDFNGDGRRETAVLYDTPLEGRYRLGLVTWADDQPVLLPQNLKIPPAVSVTELAAVDLTGDGVPEIRLRGTWGVHGSLYLLYSGQGATLTTLLSLTEQAPTEPLERDLDEDGCREVVRITGNHYVWSYAHGLTDWQVIPYVFDGQLYQPDGWREPATPAAQAATGHLRALAAGRLWDAALDAADEAASAEPGVITRWNRWLAEQHAWLFREQQRRLATPPGEPVANLVAAVADVLAGDYPTAAGRLMAAGSPAGLPLGWEVPFLSLRDIVAEAFAADPALAGTGAAQIVRGMVLLATGQTPVARLAFRQAMADWPAPQALEPWTTVGYPPQRLYGLDARQLAWSLDLDASGRPLGPVTSLSSLGPQRALAGCPTQPAFATVPESGEQVVYRSDAPPRILARGAYLHLTPEAFSPDGRWLAIDRGTSALRDLLICEVATGQVRATIPYSGRFAWSPNATALALEVARPVQPPLPWEDGGTRDLCLVDLDGRLIRRLATGDATTVWGLDSWDTPPTVWAVRWRYVPRGETLVEAGSERLRIDPLTLTQTPAGERSRLDLETARVARQLGLNPDQLELAWPEHPRFVLFRRQTAAGTALYLLPRDLSGEPLRLLPAPPLDVPLTISWGGLTR